MVTKTLKDLGSHIHNDKPCYCEKYAYNNWFVEIEELKAVAIKRAVEFREDKDLAKTQKDIRYWQGRYEEVMEFNNLIEKDLKKFANEGEEEHD